jgi:hypothetical protein
MLGMAVLTIVLSSATRNMDSMSPATTGIVPGAKCGSG